MNTISTHSDKPQPDKFDWATELSDAQGHVTLSKQEAKEIGARLRRHHAELETLILYKNMADEYGLSIFPDIAEMTAELETLRAKLKTHEDLGDAGSDMQLLRMGYAAARLEIESLRAGAPAAHQPGAAYAALPSTCAEAFRSDFCPYRGSPDPWVVWQAAWQSALRAPHGQAPAQPAPAAVAGPIGYGPKVTVRRSCSDCKVCNSESYAVQGDSGHYVYCEHPSLPESKYIGDTNWNTPHWCPVAAPTTQPAPAAQEDALDAARYRYLRDVPMDQWPAELLTAIRLQQNAKWDAAIDAARAAQEGKSHDR